MITLLRFRLALTVLVLAPQVLAQDPPAMNQKALSDRLEAIEAEQRFLREQLGVLGEDVESSLFGNLVPEVNESRFGLGPAASKVYSLESGLSIGGYGEFSFTQNSGRLDVFDAQRVITYFGYKFDQNWLFNSEIEVEHGSTTSSSGSTGSSGSVSVEFATLEYLHSDALNTRVGVVLVPMGFINELHEPTTFFTANRPQTETVIIPSTWRALGGGVYGQTDDVSYRVYAINSLNGENFNSSGLRGGRQRANRSASDDVAFVGRFDFTSIEDLMVGGSVFYGSTGQDGLDSGTVIPSLNTLIWEAHLEYTPGPFSFRALFAEAHLDDVAAFNTNTGENLAEVLRGYYFEGAVDVLRLAGSDTDQSLSPFIRYEHIDTQAELPDGFVAEAGRDDDILTFGLNWKPIDQIVFKLDFESRDEANDRLSFLAGYIF